MTLMAVVITIVIATVMIATLKRLVLVDTVGLLSNFGGFIDDFFELIILPRLGNVAVYFALID